jgi:hypothetical protein
MTKIKQSNLDSTVITGHTEETTVNDLDQVLIYDTSAGELRKMKRSNFIFQTPAVTSISPTIIDPDGSTTTTVSVTGANIEDGFTATWVGDDGTEYTPGATTFTNSTSITVDTTATMTAANSPYDLKIVNGNGIIASATNILTLDNPPEFTNIELTNLGSLLPGTTDFSGLSSAAAVDPDGDSVSHSVTAGTLPTGMTMATDGSFGGTLADPLSDQDFTFTVTAVTTNYSVARQFTITVINAAFISATGGTVTTEGDFKVHTFTADGTLEVTQGAIGPASYPGQIDYFVLAGGGGGRGDHPIAFENGGGAGAGGFRLSNEQGPLGPFTGMPLANPTSGISISSPGTYPVTVGAGGTGPTQGSNSVFSTITSTGGGGQSAGTGNPGGSGSGAHDGKPTGLGNTPPVSPPQGNNGGNSSGPRGANMGGGGGGGALGSGSTSQGGPGGSAGYVPISWLGTNGPSIGWPGPDGANRYFAGGAGGSGGGNGSGGGAGAGNGGSLQSAPPTTGSGASGAVSSPSTQSTGGSGVVVLRYKFQ